MCFFQCIIFGSERSPRNANVVCVSVCPHYALKLLNLLRVFQESSKSQQRVSKAKPSTPPSRCAGLGYFEAQSRLSLRLIIYLIFLILILNIPDTKQKNNQKCDRPTYQRTNERNLATIILDLGCWSCPVCLVCLSVSSVCRHLIED